MGCQSIAGHQAHRYSHAHSHLWTIQQCQSAQRHIIETSGEPAGNLCKHGENQTDGNPNITCYTTVTPPSNYNKLKNDQVAAHATCPWSKPAIPIHTGNQHLIIYSRIIKFIMQNKNAYAHQSNREQAITSVSDQTWSPERMLQHFQSFQISQFYSSHSSLEANSTSH